MLKQFEGAKNFFSEGYKKEEKMDEGRKIEIILAILKFSIDQVEDREDTQLMHPSFKKYLDNIVKKSGATRDELWELMKDLYEPGMTGDEPGKLMKELYEFGMTRDELRKLMKDLLTP